MKLIRFMSVAGPTIGLERGDDVVDAVAALPPEDHRRAWFADIPSFVDAGAEALALAADLVADPADAALLSRSGVVVLAPLLPSTILCTGSNYHAHNAEKANTPISGKEPEFFVKTADCVIGPGDAIIRDPAVTEKLDCETELAIVIGRPGRHIPVAQALDHVFGYTILNDVTARDRQVRRTDQGFIWYELGRSKAFDTSAPLGPCIVTADEIPDPQDLTITTRINDETRQLASTADMIWSCAEVIHFFSVNFTLRPGMVISTGTPAGTAWSVDADLGGKGLVAPGTVAATRYCLPGDLVESEISGIGVLHNPVGAP
jgi:2-keto-4-pentenoate hydratase/2-oxohepta-3-ene-1,7-dioic acid hydratase in catechol pathway